MPIKRTTSDAEIERQLRDTWARFRRAYIRDLDNIGRKVVNEARINGGYKDQTGNLRSSVGYILVVDGSIVNTAGFDIVQGAEGNGEQGSAEGKRYAEELSRNYRTGIALIVVAGMEYASYVEDKGKNVLYTSEVLAQLLAKELQAKYDNMQI